MRVQPHTNLSAVGAELAVITCRIVVRDDLRRRVLLERDFLNARDFIGLGNAVEVEGVGNGHAEHVCLARIDGNGGVPRERDVQGLGAIRPGAEVIFALVEFVIAKGDLDGVGIGDIGLGVDG